MMLYAPALIAVDFDVGIDNVGIGRIAPSTDNAGTQAANGRRIIFSYVDENKHDKICSSQKTLLCTTRLRQTGTR